MIALTGFIGFHARRTPAREALVYEDLRLGYGALWNNMTAMAGRLAGFGIGPGDVVAACLRNSPAFYDLAFAASHVGAVFLPLNYRLAADEIAWILGHAGARRLFADADLDTAAEAAEAAGIPLTALDPEAARDSRRLSAGAPAPPAAEAAPDDVFRLMYTSGTTDRPKGVQHSYTNFYWKCLDQTAALGATPDDRLLVVGPLYHVGGFDLPGVDVWRRGGCIVLHREARPRAILEAIEAERVTGAWLAPTVTNGVLADPDLGRFDTSALQWVIGGGERTPETRIREFAAAFPNARYIDAYGLTESVGGDTLMEAGRELEKIGSVGRAIGHVEVTVRDEAGRALPPGEEGEICLRGPKITRGYWRDPERTAEAFFGDRLRTGDVGYLDEEGFLYLTDRRKDMILSGGENIASSEIERVLYEHDAVHEAAAIGLPERWGERPVAVVALRPGAELTLEELQNCPVAVVALRPGAELTLEELQRHCRARLAAARFKVPKELHLRPALPRNPSGKVLKRLLRDELGGGE